MARGNWCDWKPEPFRSTGRAAAYICGLCRTIGYWTPSYGRSGWATIEDVPRTEWPSTTKMCLDPALAQTPPPSPAPKNGCTWFRPGSTSTYWDRKCCGSVAIYDTELVKMGVRHPIDVDRTVIASVFGPTSLKFCLPVHVPSLPPVQMPMQPLPFTNLKRDPLIDQLLSYALNPRPKTYNRCNDQTCNIELSPYLDAYYGKDEHAAKFCAKCRGKS